jgi:phosphatidylglycerol:prolipoprotein diacylglycerol transferase
MRPRIAEGLNHFFGTQAFTYLLPNYVIMLAIAVVAGAVWAARRAAARGLDPDCIYGLALWAIPSAILGARLGSYLHAPWGGIVAFFDPLQGAMMAYGGFAAGLAAAAIYIIRYRRDDLWRYFDCAIPAVGLATGLTRIGCFLDGDDFGVPWSAGVSFPPGSPAYVAQISAGLLPPGAPGSLPVHPVQLYLSAHALLLACAIAWWSRRKRPAGESFYLYWLGYSAGCFLLEYFRGDSTRGFLGPISISQAVSLTALALACAGLARSRKIAV